MTVCVSKQFLFVVTPLLSGVDTKRTHTNALSFFIESDGDEMRRPGAKMNFKVYLEPVWHINCNKIPL